MLQVELGNTVDGNTSGTGQPSAPLLRLSTSLFGAPTCSLFVPPPPAKRPCSSAAKTMHTAQEQWKSRDRQHSTFMGVQTRILHVFPTEKGPLVESVLLLRLGSSQDHIFSRADSVLQ